MSIVERIVVVPKQDEVVEITLRLTQAQANKVRTLLGQVVVSDTDTNQVFDALHPVTERINFEYEAALEIFTFSKEPT